MSNSDKVCFFCNRAKKESIYSSEFLFVVRDNKFPVTKHHTLIALPLLITYILKNYGLKDTIYFILISFALFFCDSVNSILIIRIKSYAKDVASSETKSKAF